MHKIFKRMIEMGWNLNNNTMDDFMEIYNTHKDFMTSYCEDEYNEDNELLWCYQFMVDFLDCLEKEII